MISEAKRSQILQKEFVTVTDIRLLFSIGIKKAEQLFHAVEEATLADGKLMIPGKVSVRRLYKMLGLPMPEQLSSAHRKRFEAEASKGA